MIKKTCSLAFVLVKPPILISPKSTKLFLICKGLKEYCKKMCCPVAKAFISMLSKQR